MYVGTTLGGVSTTGEVEYRFDQQTVWVQWPEPDRREEVKFKNKLTDERWQELLQAAVSGGPGRSGAVGIGGFAGAADAPTAAGPAVSASGSGVAVSAGTYYRGPGDGDAEWDAARLVPPVPGWHVIFAQHNPGTGLVEVRTEAGIRHYTAEELADEVGQNPAAAGKAVLLLLCYAGHVTDLGVFGARFRDRRGTFVAAADGVVWITFDGVFVKLLDPGVVPTDPALGRPGQFWLYPAARGQTPTGHDTLHAVLTALPDALAVQSLSGIPIDTPAHFMLPPPPPVTEEPFAEAPVEQSLRAAAYRADAV